ncbi:hypothetical protein [Streptomyces chartreusis]|uniref:Uncharacterized protein n=1 Tax=Streptomyces chartreusis TaxID=1969 RepID=A0A7I0Y8V0_STRCX|nr:hypothetical protein [Streptomyces chartreusis]QKZ15931.1 hypothetical protein HUT05_36785 [Streptomyces chartreusis]
MRLRHIGALTAMSGPLRVPAHADDANGSAGSAATGLRSTETPSWLVAQFPAPLKGAAAPDPLSDISRDTLAPNDVGRTPTLHTKIDSAGAADRAVARGAGAGRLP